MHGGQQDAHRGDDRQPALQAPAGLHGFGVAGVALQNGGQEFDPQDHDVSGDAEGHFHQDGAEVDLPGQEELIAVPIAPDVEEDGQARQTVTEDAGEHGGAHHGVVLPAVEDIDQDGHGIAAATQGGAHQDIVGDPEAPGVAVAQVGDRAQAGQRSGRG